MSGSTSQVPPITVMLSAEGVPIPPDTLGSFAASFMDGGAVYADSVSVTGGAQPSVAFAASSTAVAGPGSVPTEADAVATVTQSFEVLGPPGAVTVDFIAGLSVAETTRVQPGSADSQVFAVVVAPDGTSSFVELASNSIEDAPTPVLAIRQPEILRTGTVYSFQEQADAEAAFSASTQGSVSATVVLDPSTPQGAYSIVFGADPPCYVAGTRIATTRGEVPVEALRAGDTAALATGGTAPIVWVGHRRLRKADPVRVLAGAFGTGLPARDLVLSPEHALFLDAHLVPVRALVDGVSVIREAWESVTYHHVELERHGVLLAEGLPAESYLDTGNRASFANGALASLAADFGHGGGCARTCAPLALFGPVVEAQRARLRAVSAGRARDAA